VRDPRGSAQPADARLKKVLWQGAELYMERRTTKRHSPVTSRHAERLARAQRVFALHLARLRSDARRRPDPVGAAGLSVWAVQMIWIPFLRGRRDQRYRHYWATATTTAGRRDKHQPVGILIGARNCTTTTHLPTSQAVEQVFEFDLAGPTSGCFRPRPGEVLRVARWPGWRHRVRHRRADAAGSDRQSL